MLIPSLRGVKQGDIVALLRESLLKRTYALSYAHRYSLYRKLHDENVAEHCYFVSLFVWALHGEFEFDLCAALKMALVHDIPELAVSDVNHNIKRAYPEIAKALRTAETDFVLRQLPADMSTSFVVLHDDSVESRIVHLADALSVLQWYDNEESMGNTNVPFVYDEVIERINGLLILLETYRR